MAPPFAGEPTTVAITDESQTTLMLRADWPTGVCSEATNGEHYFVQTTESVICQYCYELVRSSDFQAWWGWVRYVARAERDPEGRLN